MNLLNHNFLVFALGVALLGGEVHAYPISIDDDKKWRTCERDEDCTTVKIGCYAWQAVNKNYAKEMQREGMVACKKSVDPGPQPSTQCESRMCAIKP